MAENSIKTNHANRGPPVARKPKQASSLVTAYLVVYNTISLLCWGVVLFKTVSFILQRPTVPHLDSTKILPTSASAKLSSLLSLGASKLQNHVSRSQTATAGIPIPPTGILAKLRTYLGGSYVYEDLGPWVVLTQTGALLEVVHALLGWVRSSPVTVAMQVASRIWMVWGIVETRQETHFHPLFTTMVLAWSVTECIRYAFYTCALFKVEPRVLTWLRYNTFYILYPLGAGSEAFLMFSTLPTFKTLLPSIRAVMKSSRKGKASVWLKALTARKAGQAWGALDFFILFCFVTWWPALYVLYTHMIKLRRKVYGKGGNKIGGTPKVRR